VQDVDEAHETPLGKSPREALYHILFAAYTAFRMQLDYQRWLGSATLASQRKLLRQCNPSGGREAVRERCVRLDDDSVSAL
jgi:hypothetical protein